VTGLRDAARYGYEAYASSERQYADEASALAYSGGAPVHQQST